MHTHPHGHDALGAVETDTHGDNEVRVATGDAATIAETGIVLGEVIGVLPDGEAAELTGGPLRSLLHGCHELTDEYVPQSPRLKLLSPDMIGVY